MNDIGKSVLKEIIKNVLIIVAALGAVLIIVVGIPGAILLHNLNLGEPTFNENRTAVASDGTKMTIAVLEHNFPDHEISVTASIDGERVFECLGYTGPEASGQYNIQYDLKDNFSEIVEEKHKDNISAYKFRWGIIYTVNNGEDYHGVPMHNCRKEAADNEEFKKVYALFQVTQGNTGNTWDGQNNA